MLYDVLEELGVPTKRIEYIYCGEPRPDGLQGHIIIHLRVPTIETLLELHTFQELQVENSIAVVSSPIRVWPFAA